MSKSLDTLHPGTKMRFLAVRAAMLAFGYGLIIVRTYDTLARQRKMYAQGRTTPGNIVTKITKGWHNIRVGGLPCARAIDVAFKKQRRFPGRKNWDAKWPWGRLRLVARGCGLDIPITWDKGHIVDRQGETFSQAWAKSDKN